MNKITRYEIEYQNGRLYCSDNGDMVFYNDVKDHLTTANRAVADLKAENEALKLQLERSKKLNSKIGEDTDIRNT